MNNGYDRFFFIGHEDFGARVTQVRVYGYFILVQELDEVFVADAPVAPGGLEHMDAAGFSPFSNGVWGNMTILGNFGSTKRLFHLYRLTGSEAARGSALHILEER